MRLPAEAAPFLKTLLTRWAWRTAPAGPVPDTASPDPPAASPVWPALDQPATLRLITALDRHGALGLVRDALRTAPEVDVPSEVRTACDQGFAASAAANALLTAELGRILEAFGSAGVEPLLLKGGALVATAYATPALRPMVDLDLLVSEPDLATAAGCLERLGYAREPADAPAAVHHWVLRRDERSGFRYTVELHRRLFDAAALWEALPADDVRSRATRTAAAGRPVAVPDPCDMLLHLSGHLAIQHARSERLIWIADIDRVVRTWAAAGGPGFWRSVAERSRGGPLAAAVADSVAAAGLWFGTPAVEGDVAAWPNRAYQRARTRAPVGREGSKVVYDLREIKGIRRRLAFARAYLVPPTEYMRARHRVRRPWLLPAHYLLRWWHGLLDVIGHWRSPPSGRQSPERWMIE